MKNKYELIPIVGRPSGFIEGEIVTFHIAGENFRVVLVSDLYGILIVRQLNRLEKLWIKIKRWLIN
jgi:hypothetical protein